MCFLTGIGASDLFSRTAFAANNIQPRASLTLTTYTAGVKAGSISGEVRINYTIYASGFADSIGVSSIQIFKSSGTLIAGTSSDGLITSNTASKVGYYSYIGTPGVSYCGKITVFATSGQ